jgi:toxin-antitoxin system PIN domain toxin
MTKDTSDLLLLDVNVLLALAWPNHQFHGLATMRLASRRQRWATCALTQLGFIRLSSNPAVIPNASTPGEAAALLKSMIEDPQHVYLKSLPSPATAMLAAMNLILGHQQVTDAYLIALAQHYQAKFVTFDTRVKHLSSRGAKLEVLGGLVGN